jgi:hypothetical protein
LKRVTEPLGEQLVAEAQNARKQVVICAPFVKRHALERILGTEQPVEYVVVTRWRPEEVAAGVSDLEVLAAVTKRGGRVLLCDSLHAKYFRFDERVLVGSANVTGAALGWSAAPNLELLVRVPPDTDGVQGFEETVLASSTMATEEIAQAVRGAADLLPALDLEAPYPPPAPSMTIWSPQLREPRSLFRAYSEGREALPAASAEAAAADLSVLQPPAGLSQAPFRALVASRLLQSPVVDALDQLLVEPQRFGAVRDEVSTWLDLSREEADRAWQTLMRWLLEFLPDRYRVHAPRHSEIVERVR